MALGAGYLDQPHLCREFQRIVGLTPSQWRGAATSANHVPIADPCKPQCSGTRQRPRELEGPMIHECFPYLRVSDGRAAIDWYTRALGATLRMQLIDPSDGRVDHAELVLAEGVEFMLSDAYPEMGIEAPTGNTGTSFHLHVDDADALIARTAEAGAEVTMQPMDQFYGERTGKFRDPFGHAWMVGHSIEEVETTEMQRRWIAMVSG